MISVRADNITAAPDSGLPLKAGNYIKVSIKDQGIGISKENLDKIFDPYFTTKEKGEGLGLATAYSIITKHGGYITAESELGAGTAFSFFLPASEQDIATKGNGEEGDVVAGHGKILVMDDEIMIQEIACVMLNNIGYEVEIAANGEEALEQFRRAHEAGSPFDAVLLDLTVPGGMGGKELIEHLSAIDKEVKAIVSSGYSDDPVMADYRDYGFSGVVAKPYGIHKLRAVLHDVLHGNKQQT